MRRVGDRLDVPDLAGSGVKNNTVTGCHATTYLSGDVRPGIWPALRFVGRDTIDLYFQVGRDLFLSSELRLDLVELYIKAALARYLSVAPDFQCDPVARRSVGKLEQRRWLVGILRVARARNREPFESQSVKRTADLGSDLQVQSALGCRGARMKLHAHGIPSGATRHPKRDRQNGHRAGTGKPQRAASDHLFKATWDGSEGENAIHGRGG